MHALFHVLAIFIFFPLDLSCDLPGGTIVLQKYGTFFVPVLIALVVKC